MYVNKNNLVKKIEYKEWIFSLGISMLAILYVLFYHQFIYGVGGDDFTAHSKLSEIILEGNYMEYRGEAPIAAVAYPLYHILQKLTSIFFKVDINTAASIVVSTAIVLAVMVNRFIYISIIKPKSAVIYYFIDLISCGSVIYITARCFLNNWRYYMYQAAANPVHNPTILVVRPIGFICTCVFVKYLTMHYDEDSNGTKKLTIFSILCFLATIAKPSYTVVFLPAMGIVALIYMIKNHDMISGIKLFLAVTPTIITLFLQQSWVIRSSELLSTSISWGGYAGLDTLQVLASSLVTFPIVIIGFSIKRFWESHIYQVSIIALIIGWLQMFLLSEGSSGNYTWGYDLAVQFSTLITIAFLMKEVQERGIVFKARVIVCLMVYGYQIFEGIQYLGLIYAGKNYYI